MNPTNSTPNFGGTDSYAPTPWTAPNANQQNAASALSSIPNNNQPQMQKQQPTKKGNWLTHLLPTIGSMGAWGLGALLAPETGGLSLLGSAALQGVGSAAGKVGENALEGNKLIDPGQLAGAAGEGAVGGLIGGGLNKIGSGVLGKVFGAVGNHVDQVASTKAASEAADALANEFPEKALTPKIKTQLGFGKTLDLSSKTGIPKTAQDFMQASQAATGDNGYLNGTLDHLVRNSGPIKLSDYEKTVVDALNAHPGELGQLTNTLPGKTLATKANSIKQMFSNILQTTGFKGEGALGDMTVQPDNALDLLRQVGKLGQQYEGADAGSEAAATGDVYKKVYQGLRNTIYNRPELNASVSAFKASPEDVDAVVKMTGGNKQLAQHLIDTVNNAQHANDILEPQSAFINMGKVGKLASDYNKNVIGTSSDAKAAAKAAEAAQAPAQAIKQGGMGILGKMLGPAAGMAGMATGNPILMGASVIPSVLGTNTAKNVTGKVISKLAEGGVKDNIAKVMAPTLMGTSQFLSHAPDFAPTPLPISSQQSQGGAAMQPQAGGMTPTDQYLQMALIGMRNPLYANTFAPIVQQAMQPVQHAKSANAALTSAEDAFNQAGGGQGLLGGLMSKLGGAVTGGPASTYNDQRAQLIAQLTAMGVPASAIPQLTNNPEAAAQEWSTLHNLVNSLSTGSMSGGVLGQVPS